MDGLFAAHIGLWLVVVDLDERLVLFHFIAELYFHFHDGMEDGRLDLGDAAWRRLRLAGEPAAVVGIAGLGRPGLPGDAWTAAAACKRNTDDGEYQGRSAHGSASMVKAATNPRGRLLFSAKSDFATSI